MAYAQDTYYESIRRLQEQTNRNIQASMWWVSNTTNSSRVRDVNWMETWWTMDWINDFWNTPNIFERFNKKSKNKSKNELFLRLIDNKNRWNCNKIQLQEETWFNHYQPLDTVGLINWSTSTTTTFVWQTYTRTNGWVTWTLS